MDRQLTGGHPEVVLESVVTVIGAITTVCGLVIGYRGQAEQARQAREQAARAERWEAEAAVRAARAEQREAEAAARAALRAEEERAWRAAAERNRREWAEEEQARSLSVRVVGGVVEVVNFGRTAVTDLRVFRRQEEITPQLQGLDLMAALPRASLHEDGFDVARVPVPGEPDGTTRLGDVHAEFTDVEGRRWKLSATGMLFRATRHADGPAGWTACPSRHDVVGTAPGPVGPMPSRQEAPDGSWGGLCEPPPPHAAPPPYGGPSSAGRPSPGRAPLRAPRSSRLALSLLAVGVLCLTYGISMFLR